jgi:hypothetical protein
MPNKIEVDLGNRMQCRGCQFLVDCEPDVGMCHATYCTLFKVGFFGNNPDPCDECPASKNHVADGSFWDMCKADPEDLKTFNEWKIEGRCVKEGEKAVSFNENGKALFLYSQTKVPAPRFHYRREYNSWGHDESMSPEDYGIDHW